MIDEKKFVMRCTFHKEITPSMILDCSQKGSEHFYCLSCGKKGTLKDHFETIKPSLLLHYQRLAELLEKCKERKKITASDFYNLN